MFICFSKAFIRLETPLKLSVHTSILHKITKEAKKHNKNSFCFIATFPHIYKYEFFRFLCFVNWRTNTYPTISVSPLQKTVCIMNFNVVYTHKSLLNWKVHNFPAFEKNFIFLHTHWINEQFLFSSFLFFEFSLWLLRMRKM